MQASYQSPENPVHSFPLEEIISLNFAILERREIFKREEGNLFFSEGNQFPVPVAISPYGENFFES